MAQTALLTLLLVCAAALPLSSALQCYQCSDCKEGQRGDPVQCSSSEDTCLTLVSGPDIWKSCANTDTCKDADAFLRNFFGLVQYLISDNDRSEQRRESPEIHCCTSDYCNAASTMTPATALLLVVPLVMGTLMG